MRNKAKINRFKSYIVVLVAILLSGGLLCGCSMPDLEGTKVVLITGFQKDEVFRIENISCYLPEMMVYLTNMQDQYEGVYGTKIWEFNVGEDSLEQNVKDNAIARIAQVKIMNLMASDKNVVLDEKELKIADQAAEVYYTSLAPEEIAEMGVTQEILKGMYQEYLLAQKVYQEIIKDINPEVSDDEARTITVQHILIKTYALDGTGKVIAYTDNAQRTAYEKAKEVIAEIESGAEFDELIRHYSEVDEGTISFGKGDLDPAFEEAAFNLGTGEISDIIETSYGYEIIKCLNTFDLEETDANKVKIVEEKREQVFEEEYNGFVGSLTKILNEKLWNSITFIHNDKVTTSDFFDVLNRVEDQLSE